MPVRSMVGKRPPFGVRDSSTTTPSSNDDGCPNVCPLRNAVANSNGVQPNVKDAAVCGDEQYSEEFTGESK